MEKPRVFAILGLVLGICVIPGPVVSAGPVVHECGFTVDSWLTDTGFNALPDDEFKVLTNRNGCVITTNPGGFYYNVLVEADTAVPDLRITASIPADFSLWGNNPVHVYVNEFDVDGPDDADALYAGDALSFGPLSVVPGDRIFMTIHVRYSAGCLPPGFLPKTYTFSAQVTGAGGSESSFASMTGILKK